MTLADWLSTFINMNLLVAIGFTGLGLLSLFLKLAKWRPGSAVELKLHYVVMIFILALSVVHPLLPKNEVFAPAAKVWSAASMKTFGMDGSANSKSGYLSFPAMESPTLKADRFAAVWSSLIILLLIIGGISMIRDLNLLFRTKRNSFLIRRFGRVRVFVNESIQVPFSYWLPGQANIVVPTSLLARRKDFQMAIAHELQHHRHGDTRWVYVMWGLKLICIFNPFIHLWNRWISEIQEFACDETLVDQNKVESQAYARCLIEVAQSAVNQKFVPVCATGLTFQTERNLLKRRIEKMFSQTSTKIGRSISVSAGIVLAVVMGATAFASKGLVQDRRVSLDQAKVMAMRAQSQTGFPVVVNALVLRELNRYIGTPEGRQYMRDSLRRMVNYREMIGETIQKYQMPLEFLALPITESGYRNLTAGEGGTTQWAAGIWQFIPPTARRYGLKVNDQKDERLDVPLATDAAMRYLKSNQLQLQDWLLALMGYNMGEGAVQKAIDATGSRDAWTLIRSGYEGDKNYLARVMAAVLIMKNPESVE